MASFLSNRIIAVSLRAVLTFLTTLVGLFLSMLIMLWLITIGPISFQRDYPNVVKLSDIPSTLNITRAQYEAALAQWNSLHAKVYEATLHVSDMGKWKITVNVDPLEQGPAPNLSHRIVYFERLDAVAADLDLYLSDIYTIGGLFNSIENAFYQQAHPGGHYNLPADYLIEFDDRMGYPRSFTTKNEYANVETSIENVKILKKYD